MVRRCWSAAVVAVHTVRNACVILSPALAVALVLSGASACRGRGSGDAARADSAANDNVPGANTVATAGVPTDTAAPQSATWDLDMVEGQLRDAGFTVSRDPTPVNLPFMAVPGTALDLGNATTVQVYLYGDAAARGADSDKLDPARAAPRTGSVPWRTPASLVTDNNMAAIVLTNDPKVRTRIATILTRRSPGDGALR
jgi:hypothetical protein